MSINEPPTLSEMSIAFTKQVLVDAEDCKKMRLEVALLKGKISQLEKYRQQCWDSHITVARLQERLAEAHKIQCDLMACADRPSRVHALELEIESLRGRLIGKTNGFAGAFGVSDAVRSRQAARIRELQRAVDRDRRMIVSLQQLANSQSVLHFAEEDGFLSLLF